MTSVPDPSQPTVYEMIRTLGRQMDEQRQATTRMEISVSMLVTQDQRQSDSSLNALRHGQLADQVQKAEERTTWARRASIVSLGAPLMVAFVLWISGAAMTVPTT